MNKGIAMASGSVIGFLNADDIYADSGALARIAEVLMQHPKADACYGDLMYVDQADIDSIVRYWRSRDFIHELFRQGWMPAHPTFYARKTAYDRCGCYDISYRIAADFELMFRMLEVNRIRTVYLPSMLVRMRLGGATNKSLVNIIGQNREILRTLRSHYPHVGVTCFVFNKLFNRLRQFTSRPTLNP